jgi:hypothetical protein
MNEPDESFEKLVAYRPKFAPALSETAISVRALVLILVIAAALYCLWWGVAHAEPKGEMPPGVLPAHEGWFHQPKINACCSKGDGYAITQYTQDSDHYRVPNPEKPGEWMDVPNDKVVISQDNPTGYAWLWLYPEGAFNAGQVRCFVPNGGA